MALTRFRNRGSIVPWTGMRDYFDRFSGNFLTDEDWPEYDFRWAPVVDISERKDNIILRAEIPGIKKEDIDISVHDHTLSICGIKKEEELTEDDKLYRSERSFGRFCRNFSLPTTVDPEGIKARYRDGILEVTMPKSEEKRGRAIQIESR